MINWTYNTKFAVLVFQAKSFFSIVYINSFGSVVKPFVSNTGNILYK